MESLEIGGRYRFKKFKSSEEANELARKIGNYPPYFNKNMKNYADKGVVFICLKYRSKIEPDRVDRYKVIAENKKDIELGDVLDCWTVIPQWMESVNKVDCKCNLLWNGCTCGVFAKEQASKKINETLI